MTIALWIVAGLLAAANLAAGSMKLLRSKEALQPRMAYVEDFSTVQIKLIGAAEVLGAIGLILPMLTGIASWLTIVAAFGLAVLQLGAAVTHIRRKEPFIANLVFVAAALFVGIGWLLVG